MVRCYPLCQHLALVAVRPELPWLVEPAPQHIFVDDRGPRQRRTKRVSALLQGLEKVSSTDVVTALYDITRHSVLTSTAPTIAMRRPTAACSTNSCASSTSCRSMCAAR